MTKHQIEVRVGDRFADSICTVWEIIDIGENRFKLWNRSYNAFQTVTLEELAKMKRS